MNRPSKTPDPASLRNRALGYLARREHSRAGLARKLEAAGYDPEAITPLLDQFEEKGWLSDRRFAESYIADHREKAGNLKLTQALRQHGIADHLITTALYERSDNELERARSVWKKKFGSPPGSYSESAKQIRFMQQRGFSLDCIYAALTFLR